LVIEIEDVLLARIAFSGADSSICLKILNFYYYSLKKYAKIQEKHMKNKELFDLMIEPSSFK
jgi:hypothetical protein